MFQPPAGTESFSGSGGPLGTVTPNQGQSLIFALWLPPSLLLEHTFPRRGGSLSDLPAPVQEKLAAFPGGAAKPPTCHRTLCYHLTACTGPGSPVVCVLLDINSLQKTVLDPLFFFFLEICADCFLSCVSLCTSAVAFSKNYGCFCLSEISVTRDSFLLLLRTAAAWICLPSGASAVTFVIALKVRNFQRPRERI